MAIFLLKILFKPASSCVRDQADEQSQQDTGNKGDVQIDSNSASTNL